MSTILRGYKTYKVLGNKIHIYSDETAYGTNTIVEFNGTLHYMGHEAPTVACAIFAWEEIMEHELTDQELRRVMEENNLVSQGV
jgi:hypothetical protein